MTINDLVREAGRHPWLLIGVFVGLPLVSWLVGLLSTAERAPKAPWKYMYSVLVYLACVPGMLAAVLVGYALFFTGQNLLNVELLVYFLPVISMIVTLAFIRWRVSFSKVPGFGRLSGLLVMVAGSFALALAIQKTRIWVFFGASIEWLFAIALVVFVLLKWGAYMFFRRRRDA